MSWDADFRLITKALKLVELVFSATSLHARLKMIR